MGALSIWGLLGVGTFDLKDCFGLENSDNLWWIVWAAPLQCFFVLCPCFVSAEFSFLFYNVLVRPFALYAGPVFIGVWGSSNGKRQPIKQAFKAMRQESDTLNNFLFWNIHVSWMNLDTFEFRMPSGPALRLVLICLLRMDFLCTLRMGLLNASSNGLELHRITLVESAL